MEVFELGILMLNLSQPKNNAFFFVLVYVLILGFIFLFTNNKFIEIVVSSPSIFFTTLAGGISG